jgi:hypothetical protein
MSERTIDAEKVREEHLAEVRESVHWVYLVSVLVGSTLLMLLLIAVMGASPR